MITQEQGYAKVGNPHIGSQHSSSQLTAAREPRTPLFHAPKRSNNLIFTPPGGVSESRAPIYTDYCVRYICIAAIEVNAMNQNNDAPQNAHEQITENDVEAGAVFHENNTHHASGTDYGLTRSVKYVDSSSRTVHYTVDHTEELQEMDLEAFVLALNTFDYELEEDDESSDDDDDQDAQEPPEAAEEEVEFVGDSEPISYSEGKGSETVMEVLEHQRGGDVEERLTFTREEWENERSARTRVWDSLERHTEFLRDEGVEEPENVAFVEVAQWLDETLMNKLSHKRGGKCYIRVMDETEKAFRLESHPAVNSYHPMSEPQSCWVPKSAVRLMRLVEQ